MKQNSASNRPSFDPTPQSSGPNLGVGPMNDRTLELVQGRKGVKTFYPLLLEIRKKN